MSKIERLINLIALLVSTRRPLPVGEIREKIPGYHDQSDEAFHRMFERDKTELRELGLTLEQEDTDAWGGETGYRIRERDALLDDPGLTPDEQAALSLAMQAWGGGSPSAEDGSLGLLKLSVGAAPGDPGRGSWILPRVSLDENVTALLDAVARRKRVRFGYRTGGGGAIEEREVEPYGLSHRGTWYLFGHDRARGERRTFKLSRVEGRVAVASGRAPDFEAPEGVDLTVPRGPWEFGPAVEGRIAFAPDAAWWAQRRTGARTVGERPDGWIEVAMPVPDVERFAGWLAGFADRAVALDPPELREAVVAHLRAVAGRRT